MKKRRTKRTATDGIHCPSCEGVDSYVIRTERISRVIRRTRKCRKCGRVFVTVESI